MVCRRPWVLLRLFPVIKNKAKFKGVLADAVRLKVDRIPYRAELIQYLRELKSEGHAMFLVTGATEEFAKDVHDHLDLFDGFMASGDVNLTGRNKAAHLVQKFGKKSFVYVGNSRIDLEVWREAEGAVVVGSPELRDQASLLCPVQHFFNDRVSFPKRVLLYLRYLLGI